VPMRAEWLPSCSAPIYFRQSLGEGREPVMPAGSYLFRLKIAGGWGRAIECSSARRAARTSPAWPLGGLGNEVRAVSAARCPAGAQPPTIDSEVGGSVGYADT